MITRPSVDIPAWNPSETVVDVPAVEEQDLGFVYRMKFTHKWGNWFFKRFSTWIAWLIGRTDAHETTANVSLTITEDNFSTIQTYLKDLKHNDYAITIGGGINLPTQALVIESISGSGSINFNGASITLAAITVKDVQQQVSFNQDYGTNIEQNSQYGLRVINSPRVYIENLNIGFGAEPSSNWKMISVENSGLEVYQPALDGTFTSASTPQDLVYIDSRSYVSFSQPYTITSNAAPGAVIGRAMIYIEEGGSFNFNTIPTFTDWVQNFAAQIDAAEYPYCGYNLYVNHSTGLAEVKTLFARIKRVDGYLETVSINDTGVTGLNLENINGSGTIHINPTAFSTDNFIRNCRCTVIVEDSDLEDQTVDGKYALSIIDSPDVRLTTQTVLDAGTNAYECLLIQRSGVIADDIRYINEPATPATNYIDIKENSTVYVKRILSGYASVTVPDSTFINVDGGSRLHVKSWVSVHVNTTGLTFTGITDASYVLGYTSAVDLYTMGFKAAGYRIIEI